LKENVDGNCHLISENGLYAHFLFIQCVMVLP